MMGRLMPRLVQWSIDRLGACSSTMDEARARAHAGAPDGTVLVASSMSAGRGTHGRSWHAPEGGLYFSMILRDIDDPHLLTLALGNAVADVLEVAGAQPELKWVNDVLVSGRKLAGILVEAEATADHFDFIVAGIGINVNGHAADFPGELQDAATTLEDVLGAESCIEDLEAFLFQSIERWLAAVRDGRDDDIIDAFRSRDALSGHRVRVSDGDDAVEGLAAGIDQDGHLLVEASGAIRSFANGSVVALN